MTKNTTISSKKSRVVNECHGSRTCHRAFIIMKRAFRSKISIMYLSIFQCTGMKEVITNFLAFVVTWYTQLFNNFLNIYFMTFPML